LSPLSSDTLFHFTDRVEHLIDILTNEFRPHFSLEDLTLITNQALDSEEANRAFPLVSFCDIPLSQTTAHTATYGSYAIGLTKKWGMRNGIAPVLYCYQNCPAHVAIAGLFHMPVGTAKADAPNSLEEQLIANIAYLSCFLKPYEGQFYRRGKLMPKTRFYDEREWRYVPDLRKRDVEGMSREEYLDPEKLRLANDRARSHLQPIRFEPSDIRYLIVKTESEILHMIKDIERIKSPKYTTDDIKLLTTRIISAEHIRSDF
jgi:hypothetical protein